MTITFSNVVENVNQQLDLFSDTLQQEKEQKIRQAMLQLSDAFDHPPKEGAFEWTATVVDINYGYNAGVLNACKTLKEYSMFVDRVNCKRNAGLNVEVCITEYNEKNISKLNAGLGSTKECWKAKLK